MNWELFLAAVAIGATTELLTLSDSTIDVYRRNVSAVRVLAVAVVLALVIPVEATVIAVTAFALPHLGRILGEWLRWVYLKVRIGKEQAEWEQYQRQTSARDASWSAMPEATSTPPDSASTRS